MRFRLFRSGAFWFGVPGLGLLLWGWLLSMGHKSEMGRMGTSAWRFGQSAGEIYAWCDSAKGPDGQIVEAWHYELPAAHAGETKKLLMTLRDEKPSYRFVFIPYHRPVLAYLAVWAVFVLWKSRKRRAPVPAE